MDPGKPGVQLCEQGVAWCDLGPVWEVQQIIGDPEGDPYEEAARTIDAWRSEGALVVNSSQNGGAKDTWVMR